MTVRKTDKRTERVIELLTALSTDHPPFPQPWEYDQWMSQQEQVFLELYRKHQGNARVREFLTIVDGGSRLDATVADSVRRAIRYAPLYLAAVLRDVKTANTCPTLPPTGDPVFDAWSDGAQVIHGGWGSEWKRDAVREENRQMTNEIDFRGYVRERPKKEQTQ